MRKSLILPLAMAMSIALVPAAFSQGMAPQGSTMSNTATTAAGSMAKPDGMAKPDAMKKDEKADAMKKPGETSDAMKKDGMAK